MTLCLACGRANPPEFRFCGACGTPLALEPGLGPTRRTVTVVFCDLVRSTELGERLDPESLREVMGGYFDRVATVLERHGGTVEKFIGDAVMAVFGIPQLHEDDALRAVRAVAEIQERLARFNDDLNGRWHIRLQNRTGVNTGEVVAGDAATDKTLVTGDAVNVAARLQQSAEADAILIGDRTYALVGDCVRVEQVPPIELRGKSAAVRAWRLIEVLPDIPAFTRPSAQLSLAGEPNCSCSSRRFGTLSNGDHVSYAPSSGRPGSENRGSRGSSSPVSALARAS